MSDQEHPKENELQFGTGKTGFVDYPHVWQNELEQLQRQLELMQEHAQVLAEALTFLIGCAERGLDQSATHDGLSNCDAIAKAREALARWKEAQ